MPLAAADPGALVIYGGLGLAVIVAVVFALPRPKESAPPADGPTWPVWSAAGQIGWIISLCVVCAIAAAFAGPPAAWWIAAGAGALVTPWLAYVVIRAAVQHATADRFSAIGEDLEAVRLEVQSAARQAHADTVHTSDA